MKEVYAQGLESEEDEDNIGSQITSRDVGHNIYILAHQVINVFIGLSDPKMTSQAPKGGVLNDARLHLCS